MNERKSHNLGKTILDEVAMIMLSLASVILLVYEVVADLTIQQEVLIERVDIIIALIFLGEFIYKFARSTNRKAFFKSHWWELLAAIPITSTATQALRGLRVIRLIRLIRLLRLIRAVSRIKILLDAYKRFSKQTYLIYIMLVAGGVSLAGATGFHLFEKGTNPNVHNFFDSFWWTVVTMATVGYGDIYPVTTGGRIIAMFLMVIGIGILGTFTASIISYIVKTSK